MSVHRHRGESTNLVGWDEEEVPHGYQATLIAKNPPGAEYSQGDSFARPLLSADTELCLLQVLFSGFGRRRSYGSGSRRLSLLFMLDVFDAFHVLHMLVHAGLDVGIQLVFADLVLLSLGLTSVFHGLGGGKAGYGNAGQQCCTGTASHLFSELIQRFPLFVVRPSTSIRLQFG